MPAVSNTSPLLNLAIVDQLHLLRQQFPELLIPPAVREELRADEQRLGSSLLRAALDDGWLRVVELDNPAAAQAFGEQVDRGEAEAIALALQLKASPVLIDERDGRTLATGLGLQVTGLLGILLRARLSGDLAALAPVLDALEAAADFRLSSALRQDVLNEAGEL